MAKGMLSSLSIIPRHRQTFHDWSDLEHIPERQRVPGFGTCERWVSVANPKHSVASYELDSLDVLRGAPAYKANAYENLSVWSKRIVKIAQRLLGMTANRSCRAIWSRRGRRRVAGQRDERRSGAWHEFNEWSDTEHIPALSAVPGTLCARRFTDLKGTHRYLALYHLKSPEVPLTEAWKKGAGTPWSARMRPHFRDHLADFDDALCEGGVGLRGAGAVRVIVRVERTCEEGVGQAPRGYSGRSRHRNGCIAEDAEHAEDAEKRDENAVGWLENPDKFRRHVFASWLRRRVTRHEQQSFRLRIWCPKGRTSVSQEQSPINHISMRRNLRMPFTRGR